MAKGTLDIQPEILPNVEAWLPRGITVVSSQPYGGAHRLEIEGDGVDDEAGYQLVVTEGPMHRLIALVKNPNG